jgi:hypothetical protein
MRIGLWLTMPTAVAAFELRSSPAASRRSVLASLTSLSVAAQPGPGHAAENLGGELANFGGEVLAFGPFGLLSFGLKKQAAQQKACYDAGECLDSVSYYRIEYVSHPNAGLL